MPSVKEIVVKEGVKYGFIATALGGVGYIAYRKVKSLNPLNQAQEIGKKAYKGVGKQRAKIRKSAKKTGKKVDKLLTDTPLKYTAVGAANYVARGRAQKYVKKGGFKKDSRRAVEVIKDPRKLFKKKKKQKRKYVAAYVKSKKPDSIKKQELFG